MPCRRPNPNADTGDAEVRRSDLVEYVNMEIRAHHLRCKRRSSRQEEFRELLKLALDQSRRVIYKPARLRKEIS